ncbi:MAG: hypothetical protein HN936_13695, partial [Bacteroidetes bacterium]|nr:hypothetical protein [Bacteroidota bacterium]
MKALFVVFLAITLSTFVVVQSQTRYSKSELIEDTRQYVQLLETVHPDPYINGGGKIAFHRRFHQLISSIPEAGMDLLDYGWKLQEFTGTMLDSHTTVFVPVNYNNKTPGGIPIYFNSIEDKLYVYGVADSAHLPLTGSVLLSIEGIPVERIYRDYGALTGKENNRYNVLAGIPGHLWHKSWIEYLIPEWEDDGSILIELLKSDGRIEELDLPIPKEISYPLYSTQTSVPMPSTEQCDFTYTFTEEDKQTALLVINSMVGYREAFEIWRTSGRTQLIKNNSQAFTRATGEPVPDEIDQIIQGIPAATEVFISMLQEMKSAGTKNLIIDLRRNSGGASTMADILTYLIYGNEAVITAKSGIPNEVKKLSDYYFELHSKESIENFNESRVFPLQDEDYVFTEDRYGWNTDLEPLFDEIARNSWNSRIEQMPTFQNVYESGKYDGFYCPEHVAVVSSNKTFSSGFTLMQRIKQCGGLIIGRPSGQEQAAFGSIQEYTLKNSGIKGYISHKRFGMYPHEVPDFSY